MGSSKWEEAKAHRRERRAVDPIVQGKKRALAAKRQQELIVKMAAEGDPGARRELERRHKKGEKT